MSSSISSASTAVWEGDIVGSIPLLPFCGPFDHLVHIFKACGNLRRTHGHVHSLGLPDQFFMALSIFLCAAAVCIGGTGASLYLLMCSIDSLMAASIPSGSAPIWAGVVGVSSPPGKILRPIEAGGDRMGSVALWDGLSSPVVGVPPRCLECAHLCVFFF